MKKIHQNVVGSGLQVYGWDSPPSLVFYFVGARHPTPMPTCQTTACTEAAPVGGEGERSQETQAEQHRYMWRRLHSQSHFITLALRR